MYVLKLLHVLYADIFLRHSLSDFKNNDTFNTVPYVVYSICLLENGLPVWSSNLVDRLILLKSDCTGIVGSNGSHAAFLVLSSII